MRPYLKLALGLIGLALSVTTLTLWTTPNAIAQVVRAALVRDVDHPANAPFAWEEIVTVSTSAPVAFASFEVPATAEGRPVQRLVVENVSALCSNFPDPAAGIRVTGMAATPGIGSLGSPEFFIPFDVNPAPGRQVANAPVRQYFNPGATAVMNILVFSTSGTCSFSMSGYFLLQ